MDRKYRVYRMQTRSVALILWMLTVVGAGAVGCTGFDPNVRSEADEEVQLESEEAAFQLYDSMVEVFDQETEGVETESRQTLSVISYYEAVDSERRRRFVGRIVPAGGGIGVNITAEYQREVDSDGETDWEDQARESVEREARPDELALARSVERMYPAGGP